MRRIRPFIRTFLGCMGLSLLSYATPTARLVYVRGEGAGTCVDEEGLKLSVARRLGYDPFRGIADNTLAVDVGRQGSRFVARLRLVDREGRERGQRELVSKSDDCADLTDTLALTVSIALDPLSLTRPPPPQEKPQESVPEETAPVRETAETAPRPPPRAPPKEAPPKASSSVVLIAGAGMHGVVGTGPTATFGPDVLFAVQKGVFEMQLAGRLDAASRQDLVGGGTLSTSLAGGSLAPCLRAPQYGFAFCLQGTLASFATSSENVSAPRSDSALWFGLGGRAAVTFPIGAGFGVRAFSELSVALVPYELRFGGKVVYASSPVSALLGVGPTFAFD